MSVSRETLSFDAFLGRFVDILHKNNLWDLPVTRGPQSFLELFIIAKSRDFSRLVVLCESNNLSESLYRSCYNLLGYSVTWFPENHQHPEDVAGFDLEKERFQSESFNVLKEGEDQLLITSFRGVEQLVSIPDNKKKTGFTIVPGSTVKKNRIVDSLVSWGYEPQDRVGFPKTFSSRGGILDVFPLSSVYPVRIEFFGDTVESVRLFSPVSQRRVQPLERVDILPPPADPESEDKIPLSSLLGNHLALTVTKDSDAGLTLSTQDINTPEKSHNCNNNIMLCDEFSSSVLGLPTESRFVFVQDENQKILFEKKYSGDVTFVLGQLDTGFYGESLGFCCLSGSQLLNQISSTKYRWSLDDYSYSPQETVSSIHDISWGDYLVHQDFGIGRYRGLEKIEQNNALQECIKIEYADGGVVYVPVHRFDRVHKLISSGKKEPVLSSLGSKRWAHQVARVKKSTDVVIQDLVNLYASRSRPRGFTYDKNDDIYDAVVASFPYEETPDQLNAINDIVRDMEKDKPLDRLVCGDVGFGKTEVAIRATVKSVTSGKKVLLLTPTTILADQHFISFSRRLEPVGVRVDLLSRFRKKSDQLNILEKMMTGGVDVVIGTHRLLSSDVHFPGLGLLIVDEEHRFGVKHKETLKQLKEKVDVLTLTATPIPRTLQQSLVGVRDISKIMTPPKARKPIHTFIKFHNWDFLERVMASELGRGGQVYFLHNDIKSMPFYYQEIIRRFPETSVAIAHGQMNSKPLEETVLSFFDGKIDILLCTTIIESGLDVPNANTIIINQAHRFGLAQLYQIRGRVGRSYRQAYCYLVIPQDFTLSEDAYLRLKAIEQYTSLGSGFDIAMKDLEIRGAGNLFGYKQSGNIAAVGFEMYCQILKEAVDDVFRSDSPMFSPVKVITRETTLLDVDYVEHIHDRLFFYKRLSGASTVEEVSDIEDELVDRFGPAPSAARALLAVSNLRVRYTGSSVTDIHLNKTLKLSISGCAPYNSFEELMNALSILPVFSTHPFRFQPAKKDSSVLLIVETGNFQVSVDVATTLTQVLSPGHM